MGIEDAAVMNCSEECNEVNEIHSGNGKDGAEHANDHIGPCLRNTYKEPRMYGCESHDLDLGERPYTSANTSS